MKQLRIMTVLYIIGIISAHAQEPVGVHFIKGHSWQQILDKAKAEHKYIFVDCYATWCGPCKSMDKNVYPQKAVGDAINNGFICVRLQMDRTAKDNDTVKSNYWLAAQLAKDYDIHAYPTLLFFNPEGVAVHKVVGATNVDGLIKALKNATDPKAQYYVLLKAYQAGKLDYGSMRVLANEAKGIDDKLSAAVAADYIHNYLDKLSPQEMLTKENTAWLGRFAAYISSNDAFFKLCLNEPVKADTLMHDQDFAQGWVKRVASQEVLKPIIEESKRNGKEPDWNRAKREINQRFGKSYSTDPIIDAKIDWCYYKKDGPDYARNVFRSWNEDAEKLKSPQYARTAYMGFNNAAVVVFQYDSNKADLERALIWMQRLNAASEKPTSAMLDTQANLLYKLGRKEEAIQLEAKAVRIDPNDKDIAEVFTKMKAGAPTWSLTGKIE